MFDYWIIGMFSAVGGLLVWNHFKVQRIRADVQTLASAVVKFADAELAEQVKTERFHAAMKAGINRAKLIEVGILETGGK